MRILFLVPPGNGGIRDYAIILAEALSRSGYKAVVEAWERSESGVLEIQLNQYDCVFLHYSGYGYAKRGAPLWVLQKIQEKRTSIKKLGIFFHELYAFGPPWKSEFWLSPQQRYVASKLAGIADFWMTNRTNSYSWLLNYAPQGALSVGPLPVFSNVGELSEVPNSKRQKAIIVFGSPGLRTKTYGSHAELLFSWAQKHAFEVWDIGEPLQTRAFARYLRAARVKEFGRRSSDDISRIMASAKYGVLAYPADFVAKSGVLAAYCAHGLIPIIISNRYDEADGLKACENYLPVDFFTRPEQSATEEVGVAAYDWYQGHNVASHRDSVVMAIESCFQI